MRSSTLRRLVLSLAFLSPAFLRFRVLHERLEVQRLAHQLLGRKRERVPDVRPYGRVLRAALAGAYPEEPPLELDARKHVTSTVSFRGDRTAGLHGVKVRGVFRIPCR